MKKAIFNPIIQGKVDMTYPHAGEEVEILSEEYCGMWTDPEDPLYKIRFSDKELGWWNKRDLQML